jgi:hypothetical protein
VSILRIAGNALEFRTSIDGSSATDTPNNMVDQIYHDGDYAYNGYGFFLALVNHPINGCAGVYVGNIRPLIHRHLIGVGNSGCRGYELLEDRLPVCRPQGLECLMAYSCLFAMGTLAEMR